MATEVSCGQCHGRLIVETPGVVVACPHCGTHLAIPDPSAQQVPPPVEPPPAPPPAPVPEPAFTPPAGTPAPAEVQPFTVSVDSAAAAPVFGAADAASAPEEGIAASVLAGPDELPAGPSPIGWHSAPNLYLAAEAAPVIPEPAPGIPEPAVAAEPAVASAPELFTAPLMTPAAVEPPPAAAPAAPAVETAPANTEFQFSATQQFFLGPAPGEPATFPATPAPEAPSAPPATPLTFGAAAAEPAAAPGTWTFGASPAAPPAPANFPVFGAAPAAPPAPPAPAATPAPATFPVFGAAPTAPATFPAFDAAQPPASFAPAPAAMPAATSTSAADEAAAFAQSEVNSRQKFLFMLLIIVGSYASAVTIVLAYMLIYGRTSALESLPDLKPQLNKNGEISWQYNPPKNNVPPGHVLALGQSRRFGNVKVTPLKVTRGTLRFEHYTGQPGLARPPSERLLKLWVRFENVSHDQTFAALDPHLLFTRDIRNLGQVIRANGFVAVEADRRQGKSLFYLFDMPVLSEFRIVGQNLNRELKPGESVETFVPSEEDARSLDGDLVWRFQFRKGYNPRSGRGVTTLIDVRFSGKEIQDESSAT